MTESTKPNDHLKEIFNYDKNKFPFKMYLDSDNQINKESKEGQEKKIIEYLNSLMKNGESIKETPDRGYLV